jgi:hypothetical protein
LLNRNVTARSEQTSDQNASHGTASADGKSEDAGRAIVAKNGQPLGSGESVVVVVTSSSSTTSFDLSKPYVVQDGSSSQKLLVQTHNDPQTNQTIADAYFTDAVVEGLTLTVAGGEEPYRRRASDRRDM